MEPLVYNGIRIVACNYIRKREQARTHKKKRINKKWLKRFGYRYVPDLSVMYMTDVPGYGKTLFCHPKVVEKLKHEITEKVV